MSNGNRTYLINMVLLVVVALLAGGIVGYLVAREDAPPPVTTVAPVQTGAPLNDILDVKDAWIVEGFSCPTPNCTNSLLTCMDPLARQIRGWVNNQLAMGRDGASIRAEIVQVNGAALNKLTPNTTK